MVSALEVVVVACEVVEVSALEVVVSGVVLPDVVVVVAVVVAGVVAAVVVSSNTPSIAAVISSSAALRVFTAKKTASRRFSTSIPVGSVNAIVGSSVAASTTFRPITILSRQATGLESIYFRVYEPGLLVSSSKASLLRVTSAARTRESGT